MVVRQRDSTVGCKRPLVPIEQVSSLGRSMREKRRQKHKGYAMTVRQQENDNQKRKSLNSVHRETSVRRYTTPPPRSKKRRRRGNFEKRSDCDFAPFAALLVFSAPWFMTWIMLLISSRMRASCL